MYVFFGDNDFGVSASNMFKTLVENELCECKFKNNTFQYNKFELCYDDLVRNVKFDTRGTRQIIFSNVQTTRPHVKTPARPRVRPSARKKPNPL